MGNCLKAQAADDMSLLPGSDAGRFSASSDQLGIPPVYDPEVNCLIQRMLVLLMSKVKVFCMLLMCMPHYIY